MSTLETLYRKHCPKWIKAIRWNEWAIRISERQKYLSTMLYLPLFVWWIACDDRVTREIFFRAPKTEEELQNIKRNFSNNHFERNWEIDQYRFDKAPLYDLAERRKNYREHYADRYDTYKKQVF